ncbi:hypothetical protein DPMN_004487 [Dreissena polymorpha]|uniref:Uncharacterized protein n=1 Tax=Dreissena polymorpha TaxID=45954 RepID=A0A9D4MQW5_DREPO|nr:hypothetical protein DPMN_004487 [Dreissena polymorpha]
MRSIIILIPIDRYDRWEEMRYDETKIIPQSGRLCAILRVVHRLEGLSTLSHCLPAFLLTGSTSTSLLRALDNCFTQRVVPGSRCPNQARFRRLTVASRG